MYAVFGAAGSVPRMISAVNWSWHGTSAEGVGIAAAVGEGAADCDAWVFIAVHAARVAAAEIVTRPTRNVDAVLLMSRIVRARVA